MALIVRKYTELDWNDYALVRSMVFRGGRPIGQDDQILREDTIGYLAHDDDGLAGGLAAIDMTATRGSGLLRCAGLAAVGILQEKRGAGHGQEMMRQTLRLLRQEGFVLTSLYAFRESFYRKVGYEICGQRYKIECPLGRFPKVEAELPPRRMVASDRAEFEKCYVDFAHRHSGMNIRNEDQWERCLGKPDDGTYYYSFGDPVEAYIEITHTSRFWDDVDASEIVWTTDRGYRSALAFLRGTGINKNSVVWFEPSRSPLLYGYLDQGISISAYRNIMFRVLDVPKAVESLNPTTSGSFRFIVQDQEIPENTGPWRVEFHPGNVTVTLTDEWDIAFSPQTFVQSFLGEPSLNSLNELGWIQSKNNEALESALKLLTPMPTYCLDFF